MRPSLATVVEPASVLTVTTAAQETTATHAIADLADAFRRCLWVDILPLWSTVGLEMHRGGYVETLCEAGKSPPSSRRVRVTARQIYAFSEAERLGWNSLAARDCVRHGMQFLLLHVSPDGFLQHTLAADDEILDADFDLYDQAFLLLALAHAARFLPERDAERRAKRLVEALQAQFGHASGGFIDRIGKPFPLRANPHMHLLEAGLAWVEASADPFWRTFCNDIAALFLDHLVDREHGVLLETFDEDWSPIVDGARHVVEPGHNFEWAWLLQRWEHLCEGDAEGYAERLVSFAEASGYDPRRHVVVNTVGTDGSQIDASARLWPQTERLKAWLSIAASTADRRRLAAEAMAVDAANAILVYFTGRPRGMWQDVMQPDGMFSPAPVPASSLYHVVCAMSELIRYSDDYGAGRVIATKR